MLTPKGKTSTFLTACEQLGTLRTLRKDQIAHFDRQTLAVQNLVMVWRQLGKIRDAVLNDDRRPLLEHSHEIHNRVCR